MELVLPPHINAALGAAGAPGAFANYASLGLPPAIGSFAYDAASDAVRLHWPAGERLVRERAFARAIDLLERGLAADPVAEELYRRLMRCDAALGRRAEALSVYRRCERLLSAELGIAPGPQTRTLFEALRESNTPVS